MRRSCPIYALRKSQMPTNVEHHLAVVVKILALSIDTTQWEIPWPTITQPCRPSSLLRRPSSDQQARRRNTATNVQWRISRNHWIVSFSTTAISLEHRWHRRKPFWRNSSDRSTWWRNAGWTVSGSILPDLSWNKTPTKTTWFSYALNTIHSTIWTPK